LSPVTVSPSPSRRPRGLTRGSRTSPDPLGASAAPQPGPCSSLARAASQDLVDEISLAVKFSTPFENFTASPLPLTLDAYLAYREHAVEFLESRNRRIAAAVGDK
jgi:hypothetical protein